jgi:hypothetical protein
MVLQSNEDLISTYLDAYGRANGKPLDHRVTYEKVGSFFILILLVMFQIGGRSFS